MNVLWWILLIVGYGGLTIGLIWRKPRVKNEHKLTRELYERALAQLPIAIFFVDKDLTILNAGGGALAKRLDGQRVVGMNIRDFVRVRKLLQGYETALLGRSSQVSHWDEGHRYHTSFAAVSERFYPVVALAMVHETTPEIDDVDIHKIMQQILSQVKEQGNVQLS